ncbi:MAG: NB-ARC domain-containing protein [Tychonema bourrellyi B0820]|uniref:ATPase n=1 Tax=Tychonema bourrellyi FEM_GT703 TaxID=2040638 RepID=A0A2G4F291_9CYAN|nr:NB-ARC domain-containing protein [Tychonema bourrellyi]MDQ2096167.1 NB-ARC domain-containing protein [Tychonema bourrellyi B0820]PHX55880.1 ATPase [Tychonema bourrellyi FEM_GT703]
MDVQEVLKLADELAVDKTGKYLDDIQKDTLRGIWERKKYLEIAKASNCSETHIKKVASKLFRLFRDRLTDKKLKKTNFRATMERYEISQCSNFVNFNIVQKSNINNFCPETSHPPKTPKNSPPTQTSTEDETQQKPRLDLRDAPELKTFYNYPNSPLTTLENSIAHQNCHLLTITGMTGTGKSAIARNLIPQIQTQFDRIIWRSLRTSPPLETTLKTLIQFLSNQNPPNPPLPRGGEGGVFPANTDDQLSILIETLRENRCLIILDDVQQILSSGQLSGNYKPGYENYGTLFKLIGEIPHNSCLILNSWEPPSDILTFTDDNSAVCLLQLTGLGEAATEILREKGLLDEEYWPELIEFYQGNPLWLKLVAQTINNLFSGRVSQYLSYQPVFLSDELTPILQQHYQRLSEIEKQVISQLSNEIEPVSFTQFMAKCQGSQGELFKAIQSLARRGTIEKLSCETETVFTIPPVLKQYVKMVADPP